MLTLVYSALPPQVLILLVVVALVFVWDLSQQVAGLIIDRVSR